MKNRMALFGFGLVICACLSLETDCFGQKPPQQPKGTQPNAGDPKATPPKAGEQPVAPPQNTPSPCPPAGGAAGGHQIGFGTVPPVLQPNTDIEVSVNPAVKLNDLTALC